VATGALKAKANCGHRSEGLTSLLPRNCNAPSGKTELPEGKPLQPLTSASISALNQLHTLDSSIALVPRVLADRGEDLPCILQRLVIPDLHNAPGIVGVDRLYHRIK